MQAESAGPLASLQYKQQQLARRLEAFNKVSASVGSFQGVLTSLNNPSTFRALSASSSNKDILTGSAGSGAVPGKYKVNVTQLAQAQSLKTGGNASVTSTIGSGAPTTLTFQFGTVTGGNFGVNGSALGAAVAANGIGNGALTINGIAITTGTATRSASQLADAINAQSDKTGVIAKAGSTATADNLFAGFGAVNVAAGASYALSVGGVQLGAQTDSSSPVTAASIDATLGNAGTKAALAAANITVSGTAADGTLKFTAADGSNIVVTETVSGNVMGGIGRNSATPNTGSSLTATAGLTLTSKDGDQILIGGNNPASAGFTAGNVGSHIGSGFTLNGGQASGSVTLKAGDQSLQGIRDAINKANMGVTATIVSDGSSKPYHLVLTSNKTGESSAMKITVDGVDGQQGDPAIADLLSYDPAGTQKLTQTSGAQSTLVNMNGIEIKSDTTSVKDAIQGVTMDVSGVGSTTLTVTKDTAPISTAVNDFVKAYNELNKTINGLTAYNAETKSGAILQGDASVRSIQSQLRRQISSALESSGGKLTSLSQVGITFQRDGSLAVDSTKLNKAIDENFADIGGLFAAMGSTTDGLVSFDKSTKATKPGNYAINVTSMATQGKLTSAAPLGGSTTIAANTTWNITLNQTDPVTESKTQKIAIPAGTYTKTELASMLRAAINGNATFAGAGDTVETSVDDLGNLSISSSKYGSTSSLSISGASGTAVSDLFGSASPVKGSDVVGTIGGVAAIGNGQSLTAAPGSAAEGIQVSIKGGAAGERGTVSFSQGHAFQLTNLAATFIGKDSLLSSKTNGLNSNISEVKKKESTFNERMTVLEKRYRAQFTALDVALSSMQSTSAYLTQQLAALSANT